MGKHLKLITFTAVLAAAIVIQPAGALDMKTYTAGQMLNDCFAADPEAQKNCQLTVLAIHTVLNIQGDVCTDGATDSDGLSKAVEDYLFELDENQLNELSYVHVVMAIKEAFPC